MTDCVLVAELGGNPAALAQALWALPRHHGSRVRAAFVLTSSRGRAWLDREILAPGAALDQLRASLGELAPPGERVHVRVASSDDELSPADADAWNQARWQHATAAIRAAGDDPVVFALAGGRRRTSAALTTVMFQLLARQRDRLVDVRVGDRRVERASAGFYFPDQPRQALHVDGESIAARSVSVQLVELRVPRLRRLLAGRSLATWSDALAVGQRVIEEVPAVELTVDLAAGSVVLNGVPIKFQEAELVWFVTLVRARTRAEEDGWLCNDDTASPLAVLRAMRASRGVSWQPASMAWRELLETGAPPSEFAGALSKVRSTAAQRYRKSLGASGLPRETVRRLALEKSARALGGGKVGFWRLPIAPDDITFA